MPRANITVELINDSEKAQCYHGAAREFASEAENREPKFTAKEKISLEIYAKRQKPAAEREKIFRDGAW